MTEHMDNEEMIPLSRHAEILNQVYAEYERSAWMLSVLVGRNGANGHRYDGERCVWCGVNCFDEMIYHDDGEQCPGPGDRWSFKYYPLDQIDAVLDGAREKAREVG